MVQDKCDNFVRFANGMVLCDEWLVKLSNGALICPVCQAQLWCRAHSREKLDVAMFTSVEKLCPQCSPERFENSDKKTERRLAEKLGFQYPKPVSEQETKELEIDWEKLADETKDQDLH